MFSQRTEWPRSPNALALATDDRRRAGRPILDLTGSNPAAAGIARPTARILEALGRPSGLSYQPDPRGLPSARAALARWLSRDGRPALSPDRLLLTSSTSEAYGYLFKLLADPGEAVVAPSPSYPLFEYLAGLEGIGLRPYRLAYDGDWHLDRESVRAAAAPGARAIVALHPNNPTGSFLKSEELAFLTELCAERGLALVSDEVFLDYPLRGDPARAPSASAQSRCLTFTLGGLSKVAGLPELKLGWIVATGPDALVEQALERLEILADSYLSVGSPVQEALPRILQDAPAFQASVLARLEANLALATKSLAPPSAGSVLHVEGGWTLVLRLPAIRTGEAWALWLLETEGLLVQPGYFYDFEREAFLVVSLLTPCHHFAEGMERLRRSVG